MLYNRVTFYFSFQLSWCFARHRARNLIHSYFQWLPTRAVLFCELWFSHETCLLNLQFISLTYLESKDAFIFANYFHFAKYSTLRWSSLQYLAHPTLLLPLPAPYTASEKTLEMRLLITFPACLLLTWQFDNCAQIQDRIDIQIKQTA